MADKKITDLANKATPVGTDILPIVDPSDNTTKRATVASLITALLNAIPGGSLVTAMFANNSVTYAKIDRTTDIYSTSEVAIGKWIDGKTIYRKSFSGTTTLPGAHGISGLFDVLDIQAMIKESPGTWRPIPWTFNSSPYLETWRGGVGINSTSFVWQLGASLGAFVEARVTLVYTK